MASRVNVRFVVILSAVLAMVFVGVAGAFFVVRYRSGDRYARLGDQKAAQGDWAAADGFYARAVGKERTNLAYLNKWRDVRTKKIPATQSAFEDDYKQYIAILRTLAQLQRTNMDAHKAYLQELLDGNQFGYLAAEAESSLDFFAPKAPGAIRRFRGVALVELYGAGALDPLKPAELKKIDLAKEDLEAAVKEDPTDSIAATNLAAWYQMAAGRADTPADAEPLLQSSRKIIDDVVAAKPGDPYAAILKLTQEVLDAQAIRPAGKAGAPSASDLVRAKVAAVEALKPRLQAAAEIMKAADSKSLTQMVLSRYRLLAMRIDPKGGDELAAAAIDRAMAASPDRADMIALRAEMAYDRGDLEESLRMFQRIIDLPPKPVGLEGMRLFELKHNAMFAQANLALAMAIRETDEQPRKAAIEKAKAYRVTLAKNVAEASPELLFIDGKLRYCEGDLTAAQRLLTEFVRTPGGLTRQVADAQLFLADSAARLNQAGRSREHLKAAQAAAPEAISVLLGLGRINLSLHDYAEAAAAYAKVLELDPDNETAKKQLQIVRGIISGDAKIAGDPVMEALVTAESLSSGKSGAMGNEVAAIEYLESVLEKNNYDLRLVGSIIGAKVSRGDRDGALKTAQLALAKHPDDERLKKTIKDLQTPESLEGTLALIGQANASDLEKSLARYQAYARYSKKDEARAAMAEATRLAPGDPRVLELNFVDALTRGDMAEAGRLADKSVELDADRAGGNTFKARLLLAQDRKREAEAVLRKATELGNANAPVYRLLGGIQADLGRGPDALASFRRALEINPSDLQSIKMLVSELSRQSQFQEALAVARKAELYARRDPEFMNAWLILESSYGSTQFALERRQQIYKDRPEDAENAAALADLLITRKEWEPARALIDTLRAKADSLRLVRIDARYYADRGDLDKARQAFVGYIEALGKRAEKMTPDAYVAFGQFMIQRGQIMNGLACLRQAVRYQDPATMSVDLLLGDVQLQYLLIPEAEQSYRKVLAAGVKDADYRIRKRLIETLIRQQKSEDAEKEFASLGGAADADADLMIQHAEVARGMGEPKRAREILDSAVAKFPDDAVPYLRRARLILSDASMVKDAQADLATAIRLRPGFWQALVVRARINFSLGHTEEGLKDLRAAVDTNPAIDELRIEFIDNLLSQNMESEAVQAADAGVKLHGGDPAFATRVADRFAAKKFWVRAARLYKQVYDQVGTSQAAMAYLNALLSSTPPALDEAQAVLAGAALRLDRSPDLLMARATVRKKQQKPDEAREDAIAAFNLVSDVRGLTSWVDRLRRIYPEPARALEIIGAVRPTPTLQDWVGYYKATIMLEDASTREEGEKLIVGLRSPGQASELLVIIAQYLSNYYHNQNQSEKAMEALRAGLAVAPDNVTLNNNAAFCLIDYLNRPAEALPFAERAARADPTNDRVQDTLASALWGVDRKQEAIAKLSEALRLARTEADKAIWGIKLAGWKLQTGDTKGAAALADLIRETFADNPEMLQQFSPDTKTNWEKLKQLPAAR